MVYRTTLESLEALSNMQFEILQGASKDKRMAFSLCTCSQERVETTGVLKRFLAANPDFALKESLFVLEESKVWTISLLKH